MTEEQKQAAADAASADAKAAEDAATAEKENADAEFEAGIADLSDEEKEAKRTERTAAVDSNKIDYEAELKKEQERAEKAEKALAGQRFKEAEKRRKEAEAAGKNDEDDDKPVTRKELAAVRAEERVLAQQERALEIATTLAGSEPEAKLIVAKWKGRTFPDGMPLSEQLEEMHAVVHRKRIIGERNEAIRALKGRDGAGRNAAGAHREPTDGKEPKLAPQDEQAIKAAGFTWNGTSRSFEKKFPNGAILRRTKDGKSHFIAAKAK